MRRWFWLMVMVGWGAAAQAQTFRMPCEVEASIPALDDRKLPPERAEVEIQTMGKNIFLRLNGSKYYFVTVSSLSTDEFSGKNLRWGLGASSSPAVTSPRFALAARA